MGDFSPPVTITELVQLSNIGVPIDQVTWKRVTMTSEKCICIRHNKLSHLVSPTHNRNISAFLSKGKSSTQSGPCLVTVLNPHRYHGFPRAWHANADSAQMNPEKHILAIKSGQCLQVFNLETQKELYKYRLPPKDGIVYWTWINSEVIGIVTQLVVYHWSLNKDKPMPEKLFNRHARLAKTEVVGYKVDPTHRWFALTGLLAEDGRISGVTQLYSLDYKMSQCVEAHTVCFTRYQFEGNHSPTNVLCLATRVDSNMNGKVHVVELGPYITGNLAPGCHSDQIVFSDAEDDGRFDFPISLQVSTTYGLLFMVSKYGTFYLYDLETACCIFWVRISDDVVFSTTPTSNQDGILGVSRNGQIIRVDLKKQMLVSYVRKICRKSNIADRLERVLHSQALTEDKLLDNRRKLSEIDSEASFDSLLENISVDSPERTIDGEMKMNIQGALRSASTMSLAETPNRRVSVSTDLETQKEAPNENEAAIKNGGPRSQRGSISTSTSSARSSARSFSLDDDDNNIVKYTIYPKYRHKSDKASPEKDKGYVIKEHHSNQPESSPDKKIKVLQKRHKSPSRTTWYVPSCMQIETIEGSSGERYTNKEKAPGKCTEKDRYATISRSHNISKERCAILREPESPSRGQDAEKPKYSTTTINHKVYQRGLSRQFSSSNLSPYRYNNRSHSFERQKHTTKFPHQRAHSVEPNPRHKSTPQTYNYSTIARTSNIEKDIGRPPVPIRSKSDDDVLDDTPQRRQRRYTSPAKKEFGFKTIARIKSVDKEVRSKSPDKSSTEWYVDPGTNLMDYSMKLGERLAKQDIESYKMVSPHTEIPIPHEGIPKFQGEASDGFEKSPNPKGIHLDSNRNPNVNIQRKEIQDRRSDDIPIKRLYKINDKSRKSQDTIVNKPPVPPRKSKSPLRVQTALQNQRAHSESPPRFDNRGESGSRTRGVVYPRSNARHGIEPNPSKYRDQFATIGRSHKIEEERLHDVRRCESPSKRKSEERSPESQLYSIDNTPLKFKSGQIRSSDAQVNAPTSKSQLSPGRKSGPYFYIPKDNQDDVTADEHVVEDVKTHKRSPSNTSLKDLMDATDSAPSTDIVWL
ncbi:unnamed protein product [Owenia fusiformis]|uniref:Uncharacterized protein n=1 Tax=Owenia fusiformis TaxID=6347 RepID=A0A8S4Q695_OWEFU|nr:unnamed protein product [Owenia fusiformis]